MCLWLEFSLLVSNVDTPMTALQWLATRSPCIHHQLEYDRHSIDLQWPCLQLRTPDSIKSHILHLRAPIDDGKNDQIKLN